MKIILLLVLLPLLAFGGDPVSRAAPVVAPVAAPVAAPAISFVLEQPFRGDGLTLHPPQLVGGYGAFDVVAADMDLDDDLDVFINWHLSGIELFENVGDELVVLNAPEADVSGLSDQPGVPSLFARRGATIEELGGELAEGVHIWHENGLIWSLCLVPPAEGPTGTLVIRCNEEFSDIDGLAAGESLDATRERLSLLLQPGGPARMLHLRNDFPSAGLQLSQPDVAVASWPYHVGRLPSESSSRTISLRKPDPHGVAWVQAFGSPEPELIITRGGNRGTLAAPDPPKSNRVFVPTGGLPHYAQLATWKAPREYARGRGLEWVDVDNDGVNELSIGNKVSANALWFVLPERRSFEDRAAALGLDHWFGDTSAWFDIDGDGWQDQLLVSRARLRVSLNQGGEGFESGPGAVLGLDLGDPFELRTKGFEKTCVSIFDIDADGALDVWISSLGIARFQRIFRRDGEGFVDVTAALGLADLEGVESSLRLDVDDDGYIDVVVLGEHPLLLWNRGGEHFERLPLADVVAGLPDTTSLAEMIFAATAGDMDGDGRMDLILIGQSRQIAYNRTLNDNRRLIVHLRADSVEPIGALVRLHTDDGRALVQRYGSAQRSFVSQTLLPLHFGMAAGTEITGLEVLWPGDTEWTACELPTEGELWLVR